MSTALNAPIMLNPYPITMNWIAIPGFLPVPGLGTIAVNAFVWKGEEPMLVDTGVAMLSDDFVAAVSEVIDPAHLRWIFLSHTDADHVGNLARILQLAPNAQVLTTFLGLAKLGLLGHELPENRIRLVEPGVELVIGGTTFVPVRPPYYDAPETLGFFQPSEKLLFAADSFGATLPEPVETAADIARGDLKNGMAAWSALDAPWLAQVNRGAFARSLAAFSDAEPDILLSGHLPVAKGNVSTLIDTLHDVWIKEGSERADPFAIGTILNRAA